MSKNRSTKRLFAVALSLMMVLALLPVTALAAELTDGMVTVEGGPFTYTGEEIEPTVTVKVDAESAPLVLGTDYTVSYSNNKDVGSATITITPIAPHTGAATATFTIAKSTVQKDVALEVTKTAYEAKDCADIDAIKTLAGLTNTVDVEIEGGHIVPLGVVWDGGNPSTVNEKGATYTFTGTLKDDDSNIDANGKTATATVTVTPIELPVPSFVDITLPRGSDSEATVEDLVAHLPAAGSFTVVSDDEINYTIAWTGGPLNMTQYGASATFTGTVTYTEEDLQDLDWLTVPTGEALTITRTIKIEPISIPPQVIVPETPEIPDVIEGTPDDDMTEEEDDGTLVEEDDLEEDIVDDIPETGDGAVSAVWAVLAATLVFGAAAAFVMKKKAADNR